MTQKKRGAAVSDSAVTRHPSEIIRALQGCCSTSSEELRQTFDVQCHHQSDQGPRIISGAGSLPRDIPGWQGGSHTQHLSVFAARDGAELLVPQNSTPRGPTSKRGPGTRLLSSLHAQPGPCQPQQDPYHGCRGATWREMMSLQPAPRAQMTS